MARIRLKWKANDASECGRYSLANERWRHGPTLLENFWDASFWDHGKWRTIATYEGGSAKRSAKRAAERHANGEPIGEGAADDDG